MDAGSIVLRGTPAGHVAPLYSPRRHVLDPLLLAAATEAGAEVHMGFRVQELVWEGNRVVGIRGRTPGGATVTELAPLVIGADGKHSFASQVTNSVYGPAHDAATEVRDHLFEAARTELRLSNVQAVAGGIKHAGGFMSVGSRLFYCVIIL